MMERADTVRKGNNIKHTIYTGLRQNPEQQDTDKPNMSRKTPTQALTGERRFPQTDDRG